MGVRIIGDKGSVTIGVQQPERVISIGASDTPTIKLRPVIGEHESYSADNGIESDANGTVDPTRISSDSSGGGDAPFGYTKSGRRRNRPVGSTSRGDRPADTSKTANSLATLVCLLHGTVSQIIKVPSLAISLDDSRALTAAGLEVAELYDVPLPTEKVAAWMNLGAVAYRVYIVSDKPSKRPVLVTDDSKPSPLPNFMVQ